MAENKEPLKEIKQGAPADHAQEVYKPMQEKSQEVQEAQETIHRISIDLTGAKTNEEFAEWYSHATPEEREEYNRKMQEALTRTQERIGEVADRLAKAQAEMDISAVVAAMQERLKETAKAITSFLKSDEMRLLLKTFTGVGEWIKGVSAQFSPGDLIFWGQFIDNAKELLPYIQEELQAYQEEHGGAEISFTEFMRNTDPETGAVIESIFEKVLQGARERAAADAAAKEDAAALARVQAFSEQAKQLESKLPKRYIMPNTPLANSITGRTDKSTGEIIPIVNAGAFDMPVMKSGKPGEVTAYTIVTIDPDESGLTISGTFTEYDRCVQNGIASIYEAGNRIFTPEMVYRAMTHKTDAEKISAAQKAAVTKSIEKARRTHTYQDLTEEFAKRKITDQDGKPISWKVDDYLLNFRRHDVKAGGKTIKAYEFLNEPVLLTHAKLTGQLISADSRLLDVRRISKGHICETIPTTENRQPIKEYLLRRIAVMKNDRRNKSPKQDPHILFDTLYRETGVDATVKQYADNARKYAFQVLDYWTATGYIAGYEIEKQGRKLHSICIKF